MEVCCISLAWLVVTGYVLKEKNIIFCSKSIELDFLKKEKEKEKYSIAYEVVGSQNCLPLIIKY
jgi:hypothetical protein